MNGIAFGSHPLVEESNLKLPFLRVLRVLRALRGFELKFLG